MSFLVTNLKLSHVWEWPHSTEVESRQVSLRTTLVGRNRKAPWRQVVFDLVTWRLQKPVGDWLFAGTGVALWLKGDPRILRSRWWILKAVLADSWLSIVSLWLAFHFGHPAQLQHNATSHFLFIFTLSHFVSFIITFLEF